MAKMDVIGGAYKGRFLGLDGQECINLYTEMSPSAGAKNVASLIGTPGLKILKDLELSAPCRGLFTTARDRLLIVVGNRLLELTSRLEVVTLGTLSSSNGTMSFAEIDKQPDPDSAAVSQVMMVDGESGHIFNTSTNTLTTITGDYKTGTSVISQNGFFLQNINDSNKFIYSNYLDGLTWSASLNYIAAESSPDPIESLALLNNQVWLMNTKSIEIWDFTGDPNLLWRRSGVGYINTGVVSTHASSMINGTIAWLGTDQGKDIVWMSGGSYNPTRISTHAIEHILGTIDTKDCISFAYQQEGHQFFVFNFLSGNRTLVYDVSTAMWHERGSYNPGTGLNDRHIALYTTVWGSKIVVCGNIGSQVFEWSLDQYTDNGRLIKRVRTCPHIHADRKRISFHEIELDVAKGYGLTGSSAYGTNPEVVLTISNDGGYNYLPHEIKVSAGKVGARLEKISFHRLGMSRDRVHRFTFTAPVRWCVIDGSMNVTVQGS